MKRVNDTGNDKTILIPFVTAVMAGTGYVMCAFPGTPFDMGILGVSLAAQVMTIGGVLSSNMVLTEIGHCIFGAVVLLTVLFSSSMPLLGLVAAVLAATLVSRYLLGKCVYEWRDDYNEYAALYPDLPWGTVYFGLFCVAAARFVNRVHSVKKGAVA